MGYMYTNLSDAGESRKGSVAESHDDGGDGDGDGGCWQL